MGVYRNTHTLPERAATIPQNPLILSFAFDIIILQGSRRTPMDTDNTLPDEFLSEDILPDGLPKILPPYENGIFRSILTFNAVQLQGLRF